MKKGVNTYRTALRGLRPLMMVVLVFTAMVNILMLTGSIYMLQVYDRVLTSGSVETLIGLFSIVVLLYAFMAFFDFLRGRLMSRGAMRLDAALGESAFEAGLSQSADRGINDRSGSLRPLQALDTLRRFLSGPAVNGLLDAPWAPLYLCILFMIHPWLGWLTVAGACIVAIIAFAGRRLTYKTMQGAMRFENQTRTFVERSQRNADLVAAMGMQHALNARWRSMRDDGLSHEQSGSAPYEILTSGSRAFRMLLQSAILTLGAFLVLQNEISAGMIIASSILSGRALAPVDQIIGQWRAIGQASESHKALKAFFADRAPSQPCIELPAPTGHISVNRLTKYAGSAQAGQEKQRILTQVGFELSPGDGLGVIGNSASGKSTLARILVGAWLPDNGDVRLDGTTFNQWDRTQLGRAIGYMPQSVEMLPGTIRENIARFDPTMSDDQVIAAAKMAGIHEMILKLPDGYTTLLGNGAGDSLSGGQIQRLGLARAVCGMPKLVVLDEPNANLDADGDKALTQAITTLRASGAAVIVMAHRPSAITAVNKVLILHNGMVAQFGEKDEIMSRTTQAQPQTKSAVTALMTNGVTEPSNDNAAKTVHGKREALFQHLRSVGI